MIFRKPSPQSKGTSNLFLKLENGTSVKGVIRGELFFHVKIWPKGPQDRVKVNFIMEENGKFVAKIWDFPRPIQDRMFILEEAYKKDNAKSLTERAIKVFKNEKGFWDFMPLDPLTDEHLRNISLIPLHILDKPQDKKYDNEPELPF